MKKLSRAGLIHPLLAILLVALLSIPLGFYGTYLYISPTLPDMQILKNAPLEVPLQVYTQDGKMIGEFGEKFSEPVTYPEIPVSFVHAFLAAEDASFFSHSGVSFKGLGRAVAEAMQSGETQSGGSTITMQVAKNYYLSPERTMKRKLTEIFLARKIEQTLTKPEIFTLYVNKIFLGQHAYGISAAARVYYNKSLKELTIAEMAMIAGLPKAPSKYNPVVNPARALERRNWIIGRMLQLGYINQQQYQTAVASPIGLNMLKRRIDYQAPYLAEMVRTEMVERFGKDVLNSGWKIYTTVRSDRQSMAEQALKQGLEAYDRRHGWRGAEAKDKPLSTFFAIGSMLPAKVSKVQARRFEATLKDGQTISVEWSGMSWAHKYINANRIGNYPSNASQIVEVNDIVRVRASEDGKTWALVQIPKVQGQLVALNPENGALEAVVGGYDYAVSKFNRSTQGWRQPGSTIKPFIYSLALERGYTPYSTVSDSPLQVGKWRPQNSDGKFMGAITLRRALYLSRNLVSIRLLQSVGIERSRNYLNHFGFVENELPRNLTLALGTAQALPIQVATGYAAFANGGYRIQPYFIERIFDYNDQQIFEADPVQVCRDCANTPAPTEQTPDTTLIQPVTDTPTPVATATPVPATTTPAPSTPTKPFRQAERIMKAAAAYDMANILRDVVQHGTARAALKLGRNDIGGKTGTTNDAKDAWFSGFHPKLVAVAWVGFDQPTTLGRREYGGVAALPIWTQFMEQALVDVPEQWVTRAGGTQTAAKTPDEIAKQQAADEAVSKKEAQAKAPPMAYYIRRPRPATPPPTDTTAAPQTNAEPSLPVVRLSPNASQQSNQSSTTSPDQIF